MMIAVMICCLLAAAGAPGQERGTQSKSSDPELSRILSLAESQHEIVMILVRKGEFAAAAGEAQKIFDLDWPAAEEPRLLRELLGLSDQFLKHDQPELGLRLLEQNTASFKAAKHQAAVWKERGYLFKKMGQDDKALECFRKAQQLEKSSP